ncbi:MAG: PBECR4 domain-containing protein [Cellulosilyticaceae bacterium]
MLTKEQLLDLEVPPKFEDITLDLLQEFYDAELTNRTYTYTLRQHKQVDTVTIKIRFFEENMPHLLGIQKVPPRDIKYRFEGRKGYDGIKSKSITIKGLIGYDEQKSKEDRELPKIEKRLTHFYLIPKLMEECSIVKF